jgi:ubiquinone/menaquinone biosynthesis C-methylase UbiE
MHGLGRTRHDHHDQAFQGRSSRVYDVFSRRVFRRMYRRIAADVAAATPDGAAVLDVGTGPGVLLVELADRRPDLRLTGVDLSADMIAAAARNLERFGDRARAQVGDVTRLPFPDQSYDVIVSSLSLHHWANPAAAAPELARVLAPGGKVYIYDFGGAPFDALSEAARASSVLNGRMPERSRFRTGIPFLRCVRYVMSS